MKGPIITPYEHMVESSYEIHKEVLLTLGTQLKVCPTRNGGIPSTVTLRNRVYWNGTDTEGIMVNGTVLPGSGTDITDANITILLYASSNAPYGFIFLVTEPWEEMAQIQLTYGTGTAVLEQNPTYRLIQAALMSSSIHSQSIFPGDTVPTLACYQDCLNGQVLLQQACRLLFGLAFIYQISGWAGITVLMHGLWDQGVMIM